MTKYLVLSLKLAITTALTLVAGPLTSAHADTTYVPANPNGQKVYLSRACHGAGGSSACVTNIGCKDFSENYRSRILAGQAVTSLLNRGYRVRIGDGGVTANIASSNSWNATMHIPLHSNAAGAANCAAPVDEDTRGTHVLYRYTNDRYFSEALFHSLNQFSPGTNDKVLYRTNLGELNSTDAVSGYLESEFHDWNKGVDWLRGSANWAYLIGAGVDYCRGSPRQGQGTTGFKYCPW